MEEADEQSEQNAFLEHEELGKKLQDNDCGGYVHLNGEIVHFYTCLPSTASLALVSHGTLIPFYTGFLKKHYELCDQAAGLRSLWTSQKKGIGRLKASCLHAGEYVRNRSMRQRGRHSRKCGCNAMVRASPLDLAKHSFLQSLVNSEASRFAQSNPEQFFVPEMWCIIHYCGMKYSKHELERSLPEVLHLSRGNDIL